jgi:hypothetical protein
MPKSLQRLGHRMVSANHVTRPPPGRSHSADYRSVRWDGARYSFTPTQAIIIHLLWDAMDAGTPSVSQEKLIEEADSNADTLRDLFRSSKAWQTLIVSGTSKGTYRLAE